MSGQGFTQDNCFSYSAALSFYTLFSVAPIIFISIYVASIFASDVNFQQEVISQFRTFMGPEGAEGVSLLLDNLNQQDQSTFQLIVGIVVLIVTSTNIFVQIQNGFNAIYRVRPKKSKNFIKLIVDRAISLGMIVSLGFLLIIALVVDAAIVFLKGHLEQLFEHISLDLITLIENLILLGVIWVLIYAILHFLPDVSIAPKYKFRASFMVTLLLIIGKFAIGWYIGQSQLSELGGASASIIVLMLWVYYSSIILFFGAEVARGMAVVSGHEIRATAYAERVKYVKVE
ncbi:MAG: YihY/virulence factor BrkB family protein [Owenweeksia sp.]|nr:YihY/virulence factor BrkB family protein [Owenweeksia sp.]